MKTNSFTTSNCPNQCVPFAFHGRSTGVHNQKIQRDDITSPTIGTSDQSPGSQIEDLRPGWVGPTVTTPHSSSVTVSPRCGPTQPAQRSGDCGSWLRQRHELGLFQWHSRAKFNLKCLSRLRDLIYPHSNTECRTVGDTSGCLLAVTNSVVWFFSVSESVPS